MSEPSTMEGMAERAMAAAKTSMGGNGDVYQMNGTDQGNITNFAIELLRWDAARLAAEAAGSRRKPVPEAQS